MSGDRHDTAAGGKYDFQTFPENRELARNIEQRMIRRGTPVADGPSTVREIADLQRYIAELGGDVRAGDREAAAVDSVNIATSAYVISRILAPAYYESKADLSDVGKFIRNMGDAIALNEIDVDLGTGRWSTAMDLIVDMISSLSVLTGTLAIEAGSEEGYVLNDLDFNVLTSCSLIAAYAMIVYQCAKNGTYRGQVLQDLKPARLKPT